MLARPTTSYSSYWIVCVRTTIILNKRKKSTRAKNKAIFFYYFLYKIKIVIDLNKKKEREKKRVKLNPTNESYYLLFFLC